MKKNTSTSRSALDIALRVSLTVVVLVLLWMGIRLIALVHGMTESPGHASEPNLAPFAGSALAEERAEQRARFPLPLFPGAQDPEFGEMEFNARPFFRCDYDVSARPEEILFFYRNQLSARGWRDITEDAIRQAAIMQQPEQQGVLDFQNETFLRFYDHIMKTQASFSRSGGHVQVVVKPGAQSWSTRVGITYIEYSSPGELSQELQRSLGVGGIDQPNSGPATFAQNLGGQRAETTILTSRLLPGDYRNDLVDQYRNEGWVEIDVPVPVGSEEAFIGSLVRDKQMIFLNVTYDPKQEVSRAVISTMGPR